MEQNYYDILSVTPDASKMAIREAYLRLKNTYSNSSVALYSIMSDEEAKLQMNVIEEAFHVLNDENRRAQYDETLKARAKTSMMSKMPKHLGKESLMTDSTSTNLRAETPKVEAVVIQSVDTIHTIRSTLKVTRVRAYEADHTSIQAKFKEIMEKSDLADGATLVKLRDAAGVSEAELLERTKISIEYVRAMEANAYDRLPQTVYVKGFLRNYLKYLNVADSETVVAAYAKKYDESHGGKKN